MIRYLRQRDNYNCGPVAIINALKFFGERATQKDISRIAKIVNCKSPHGTSPKNMNKGINKIFKCEKMEDPTMRDIDQILLNGNPVILNYLIQENGERWGHYIFIPRRETDGFIIINENKNRTVDLVNRTTISKWLKLKKNKIHTYPRIWILKGVK